MSQPLTCEEIAERTLVERYVAGKLSTELTDRFEIHLIGCDRCQSEVRLAWAVRQGLDAIERSEPGLSNPDVIPLRPRRLPRVAAGIGLVAAAAAILLVAVPSLRIGDPTSVVEQHRAPVSETPGIPVPIAPVGLVAGVDQIVWTGVTIADRYRLTLLDQDGTITWEYETSDTFAVFPRTVVIEEGTSFYWKIDARIGFDRWIESEMATFQVASLQTDERP
jgi:hypothetical protein